MKSITYSITDKLGLHARPAGLLVKKAMAHSSEATISTAGKSANAKRLMSVMRMAIKQGTEIMVTFSGEDEDEAATAMEVFLTEQKL